MSIKARHMVTGRDADGKSVIVSDEATRPVTVTAIPGSEFYMVWGTDDGIHTVGRKPATPKVFPFFPGPGGTRFLLLRWPSASSAPAGDLEHIVMEIEEKLPGMVAAFEPEHPGMHTTAASTTACASRARCTSSSTAARRCTSRPARVSCRGAPATPGITVATRRH